MKVTGELDLHVLQPELLRLAAEIPYFCG